MYNDRKIKGITQWMEVDEDSVYKGLMLRYVNGDVSFDIVDKIDSELKAFKRNEIKTDNYKRCYANLTYWKYKFLSSYKNINRNNNLAMKYLQKAYKAGSPDAIAQYGYFAFRGEEIFDEVDEEYGLYLFDKALNGEFEGNFVEFLIAEAMFNKLIEKNDAFDKEKLNKIAKFYEIALSKGVVVCFPNLARVYIMLEKNLDLAEKYLKKARNSSLDYVAELEKIQSLKKGKLI